MTVPRIVAIRPDLADIAEQDIGGLAALGEGAFIVNAIRLPFPLALVGTLSSLEIFRLAGLYIGPVIMAVLSFVWHEAMDGVSPICRQPLASPSRRLGTCP